MLTLAQGLHINLAESFLELHQGLQLPNHPGSLPSVPTGGSPAAQSDSSPASSRSSTLLQLPPHFFSQAFSPGNGITPLIPSWYLSLRY